MIIDEAFSDIKSQTGADDLSCAILTLAEVIHGKRLTLDDADCISHGIYMALNKLIEAGKPICVLATCEVMDVDP